MRKERESIELPSVCEECGGAIVIDRERGERVCINCGLVQEDDLIDSGPDYRKFSDDSEKGRNVEHYGSPENVLLHDKGLSTEISTRNRDASGKPLSPSMRSLMYRLRRVHHQTRMNNAYERSFSTASSEIVKICSRLGLPRIYAEKAAVIYRKALKKNLIRGRSIIGVSAACVYAACRMEKNPRTLDELAEVSSIGRKEVGRTYRFVAKRLHLHIMPSAPDEYIVRFSSELGISFDTQHYALDILRECTERDLMTGRGPIGVAASAIYIASVVKSDGGNTVDDDHITQKKIAEVTGITEVTIRNRYKEIIRVMDIPEFNEKYRRGA